MSVNFWCNVRSGARGGAEHLYIAATFLSVRETQEVSYEVNKCGQHPARNYPPRSILTSIKFAGAPTRVISFFHFFVHLPG